MREYGTVLENVDLKKYNTYGNGGNAKYLVMPDSLKDLQDLLAFLQQEKRPWYILGGGSNVILPDTDFNGVIIKLDHLNNYSVHKDIITVGAGITLGEMVNKMLADGYTNYANLLGIPGLLGGAIIGNAGANGTNIFDNLLSVTILRDGNIVELKKDDINYDYRYTEFKNTQAIILNAKFQGIKGNVAMAKEMVKENLERRKNTQPLGTKNAGSVFKNPSNFAAGYLIERAGLKGFKHGGAKVSDKHANFIINFNNATSRDIIELITIIKTEVKKRFQVDLELEQIIVNW